MAKLWLSYSCRTVVLGGEGGGGQDGVWEEYGGGGRWGGEGV